MATPKATPAPLRPASTLLRLVAVAGPSFSPLPDRATIPDPPAEFDEAHAEQWRAVIEVLQQNGSWRPGVEDLVRLYCVAFCEATEARRHVIENGLMIAPDDGGPKVLNPYRSIAREAEATTARLARMLGLVPGSRHA